jgi:hypothetical protein
MRKVPVSTTRKTKTKVSSRNVVISTSSRESVICTIPLSHSCGDNGWPLLFFFSRCRDDGVFARLYTPRGGALPTVDKVPIQRLELAPLRCKKEKTLSNLGGA